MPRWSNSAPLLLACLSFFLASCNGTETGPEPNEPPVVRSEALPTGVVGDPYDEVLAASGGDGTYAWSLVNGALPVGLTLDASGRLSGTPTAAASSAFEVRVTSGDGQSATAAMTLVVYDALLITTDTLAHAIVGVPYGDTLSVVGGDGAYAWSLTEGALPDGLAFDTAGTISGTATDTTGGDITVRVTSGDGQTSSVVLALAAYDPVSVGTVTLPSAVVGVPYATTLSAGGGDGSSTWSLTAGALPAGLTLGANGDITGTPSAAGSAAFTAEVSTGDGQTATTDLAITTWDPVVIGASALPEAEIGASYSQTLTATGGDGTYEWSLVSGALPDGLALDSSGLVSGAATTATGARFTVQVATGDGQTATADLDLKAWKAATFIEGYAGATSIDRGGSIDLFTSTDGSEHAMRVYRVGWYGGAGRALMSTVDSVAGQQQAVPAPDPTTGLVEAGWDPTYTLQTDPSWTSGVYIVELDGRPSATSRILFVVRDDASPADLLIEVPVTTYQAYNNWGGKSLYDFNSTGGAAYKVSFDRPYVDWSGAGGFFDGDYHLVRWIEREGYQATYVTSVDLERDASVLSGPKVFVSNFHDEYWSRSMRENLRAAQDTGLHTAFFGANNVYWQIRFEDSSDGRPDRVVVGYKSAALDPLGGTPDATVRWREAPVNEPENSLLGVMYDSDFAFGDSFDWVVQNSSHWVYDGTGLADGDLLPGLVGYEYDRVWTNGFTPPGITVLAASPVVDGLGTPGTQNASIVTRPSGAIVFTAGTMYWSWRLDDNDARTYGEDARVQQMTRNLLDHMLSGS